MPTIGPNTGGERRKQAEIHAGEHVMAITRLARRQSKTSGADYCKFTVVIAGGPDKGKRFYTNMSCDMTKTGAVGRWQALIAACGVKEEFELGDSRQGTAHVGDQNIQRLFFDQPFVGRVAVSRNGEYTNYDLERIQYPGRVTDAQRQQMLEWLEESSQRQAAEPDRSYGDDDRPPTDDGWDDETPPPPNDAQDDVPWGDPVAPPAANRSIPDDDDIPF